MVFVSVVKINGVFCCGETAEAIFGFLCEIMFRAWLSCSGLLSFPATYIFFIPFSSFLRDTKNAQLIL